MSPRVSCRIARRYHFHRNDESSFGPEHESSSYASGGFLNPVSLVFGDMRQAQSIWVFVFSLFDDCHVAADSVAARRGRSLHCVGLFPADDCKEGLEPSG